MIDTTLGHYRIVEQIGAGGMGEVYRARDERLDRDVAIKVLPPEVAGDPERLARFEREAKLLASLNHPCIATLYGLEEHEGRRFLVMELVEGETLAARIKQGPLPVGDALEIARQIAEGLEAAHERGIVHRDLKPANVVVSPEGEVKILDFGLARAWQPEVGDTDLTHSPTVTAQMTAAGVLLGTAAYMSPEQARGERVDKRTDIWAFGCVLYEMLSGTRAFDGPTVTDTLAAVIEREPKWALLPADTPHRVDELLHRCLGKDLRRRLRDVGDAWLELSGTLGQGLDDPRKLGSTESRRLTLAWWLAGALTLLMAALVTWTVTRGGGREPSRVVRLVMPLPGDAPLLTGERPAIAVSPDGAKVVYVGGDEGEHRLYLRPLGEPEAAAIEDTEGAVGPFFSPDGASVGFFADGGVRWIALSGGAAQILGDTPPVARGAHWCGDGTVLICPNKTAGLARVAATGGPYELITTPNLGEREGGHCWPQLLPDGHTALVTVLGPGAATFDDARIVAVDLVSGQQRVLIEGGSFGRYVPSGHLVFARRGSLLAVPFDARRLEPGDAPVSLVDGVLSDSTSGVAQYAVSKSGTLVYAAGGQRAGARRTLLWVDRDGREEPVTEREAAYGWPRPSPDGRRLAVAVGGARDDIWVLDLERGTFRRMTFEGRNLMPIWTPDGRSLTYSSVRADSPKIYSVPADGSGASELLVASESPVFATSWSPDGQLLAYTSVGVGGKNDIFIYRGGEGSRPLTRSRFSEGSPKFSPDGRWLAFVSDESGRLEVYLRRFPETERTWQVSTGGGRMPVWARSGDELYYRRGDAIYAAAVDTAPQGVIGRPELLFRERFATARPDNATFDVAPDGRFIIVREAEEERGPGELVVVLNWSEELKRLVPPADRR